MREDQDQSIRILVVDDSPTMRMTLEATLGRAHRVILAEDGRQGLDSYYSGKPDIVLLDINMPEVDGFQFLEHIRSMAHDHETFILILTGEEGEDLKPRCLNLGANDFLFKPFDRVELLARVGVAARQVLLTRRIKSATAAMSREIDMLASLQAKLLPQSSPLVPGLRIESLYRPSGKASGDFFDYFLMDDDLLRVIIADVSGHGARAAFIMGIVRTLFRLSRDLDHGLERTLHLLNSHLIEIIGREHDFVTAFVGDIDFSEKNMKYINAGHCPGVLQQGQEPAQRLGANHPLLGFFPMEFTAATVSFPRESALFLYTDGFFELVPAPDNGNEARPEPGKGSAAGPELDEDAEEVDILMETLDSDMFMDLVEHTMNEPGHFLTELMRAVSGLNPEGPVFRDDLTGLWITHGVNP